VCVCWMGVGVRVGVSVGACMRAGVRACRRACGCAMAFDWFVFALARTSQGLSASAHSSVPPHRVGAAAMQQASPGHNIG